jgi:uncharacterized SAM-binding protein YcdF (DUF218 family)
VIAAATLVVATAGRALVIEESIAAPDAIVALGSHEWERLPLAAEEARKHPASIVVLTQPKVVTNYNCHDCNNRVALLESLGVNANRIRLVQLTLAGTYGEAVASRDLLREVGVRRVLVVTSPYHTRRTRAVFRDVLGPGITVGVEPATRTSPAHPATWWAAPYDRWYVAYEWAAIMYYAARYRIFNFA